MRCTLERTNGTWCYEFHGCWEIDYEDLASVNRCIDAFADDFNPFRPHGSLGGLTPEQHLKTAA